MLKASIKFLFSAFVFALLWSMLSGCSRSVDTSKAEAIKALIVSETKNDTSAFIRKRCAMVSSSDLASEKSIIDMYGIINQITYKMHSSGDDVRTAHILFSQLKILRGDDRLSVPDARHLISTYISIGVLYNEQGMSNISLDYYMQGLKACTDTVFDTGHASILNNIGVVYAEGALYDEALKYFQQALQINQRRKYHTGIALNYANMAEIYFKKGDNEKAMAAAQQSLDHINSDNQGDQLADMRLQQGLIYAATGDYDVAMLRFTAALKKHTEIGNIYGQVYTNLEIGNTYLKRNMADSAFLYASRAEQLSRENNMADDLKNSLHTLAEIHTLKGEYDDASRLMKEYVRIEDSLRNEERQLRLRNWNGLGKELTEAAAPDKKPLLPTWVIAALALLLIGLVVMFILYMRRRKDLSDCRQKGHEQLREHSAIMDKRNREMTTLSLEKIRTQEGLTEVCDNLRAVLLDLNPKEKIKRDRLNTLLRSLDGLQDGSADEEFKRSFEHISPNFYLTLSERFPDLTARDLRLCAFLHLGLTTKEIAALTYREVRSVESARNRLRKKLGLELTDDLTAYLRSV